MTHARDNAAEPDARAETAENVRSTARPISEHLGPLQDPLTPGDRFTAIGQLVEGLAHDLNSPLSVVITNLSVLGRHTETLSALAQAAQAVLPELLAGGRGGVLAARLDASVRAADLAYTLDDLPDLLSETNEAARRVADLVASMAAFARWDSGQPRPVDIQEVLEAALTLASNPLRRVAHTVREYTVTPPVLGRSPELTELFLRLLLNAGQALEHRPGTVTISTSCGAGQVVVQIRDTGCGIPRDDLERVFEPFFTTRAATRAAGMGLAVSAGIVARAAGSIALESEVDTGTTVTVRLPAAEAIAVPGAELETVHP